MPKIEKEQFLLEVENFPQFSNEHLDFLYDVYEIAFDGISDLKDANGGPFEVNSKELLSYIFGEFVYSTSGIPQERLKVLMEGDNFASSMASVAADKYLSLSKYSHRQTKFTNLYLPPISSLNLYVNLMLNIVEMYPRQDPRNTLIIDLLRKSLSISRSIINLLCDGYETEAFAIWRTLHECECTLILLDKYGDIAINSYLTHMRYALAYKGTFSDKEEETAIFATIKQEMADHELKSKDMKKFIEYGWMWDIPESETIQGFKLNFRDGLETLAGLHNYSEIYMMSSEILHSTPLLIYSNSQYFYYLTLLNLYESFFRIESVFTTLFFKRVGDEGKKRYMEMRKLYYSQLVNIHKRESIKFTMINKKQ